jgi:hypothetical protein
MFASSLINRESSQFLMPPCVTADLVPDAQGERQRSGEPAAARSIEVRCESIVPISSYSAEFLGLGVFRFKLPEGTNPRVLTNTQTKGMCARVDLSVKLEAEIGRASETALRALQSYRRADCIAKSGHSHAEQKALKMTHWRARQRKTPRNNTPCSTPVNAIDSIIGIRSAKSG